MAALDIENALETALLALVNANSYVAAQGINTGHYGDHSDSEALPMVVVRAEPARRIAPNYSMYEVMCELASVTKIDNDDNRAVLNRLYQECMGIVQASGFRAALNSAAATLAIDGIVPQAGTDDVTEDYQAMTTRFAVYLTKAAA